MLQRHSKYWFGEIKEAVMKIWVLDGARGFYAGMVPGLLLCSTEAMQIYLYTALSEGLCTKDSTVKTGGVGGLSKLLSTVALYPLQTMMYRLQQEQYSDEILKRAKSVAGMSGQVKFFNGFLGCVRKTYENLGVKGFYRGLPIQMVRVLPSNALFFVIYETVFKYLSQSCDI